MRIEARNLIKVYGDRSVVNDVTFDINKGEVVCLLGPNGAGKTTTFYMVVGLVKPYKGHIFLDDEDISYASVFIFNGALGIINYWVKNDFDESVDYICNLIEKLSYDGIKKFIYSDN